MIQKGVDLINERSCEITSRTQMILIMEDQLRGLYRKYNKIIYPSETEKHQQQILQRDIKDLKQQISRQKEQIKKIKVLYLMIQKG